MLGHVAPVSIQDGTQRLLKNGQLTWENEAGSCYITRIIDVKLVYGSARATSTFSSVKAARKYVLTQLLERDGRKPVAQSCVLQWTVGNQFLRDPEDLTYDQIAPTKGELTAKIGSYSHSIEQKLDEVMLERERLKACRLLLTEVQS